MGLVSHLPEVMECFAKAGGLPPDTRVCYYLCSLHLSQCHVQVTNFLNFVYSLWQLASLRSFTSLSLSLSLSFSLSLPHPLSPLSTPSSLSPSSPSATRSLRFHPASPELWTSVLQVSPVETTRASDYELPMPSGVHDVWPTLHKVCTNNVQVHHRKCEWSHDRKCQFD